MDFTLKALLSLLLICLFNSPSKVNAAPSIFQVWKDQYPESQSSEIACQLCHEISDGGDGWNEYGWAIRVFHIDDGYTIIDSFKLVEQLNSDFDPEGLTNITEINRSMYPGWINGNSNIIYYKDDGGIKLNQPSPFVEVDPTKTQNNNEICFPISTTNKTVSLICL